MVWNEVELMWRKLTNMMRVLGNIASSIAHTEIICVLFVQFSVIFVSLSSYIHHTITPDEIQMNFCPGKDSARPENPSLPPSPLRAPIQ